MKVLLVCGLILAGALFAEAANGRELCGLSNDKIKQVLSCMAQHAPPQVKTKALMWISALWFLLFSRNK
ncbi:hypothetical protein MTO96_016558 [Rhipicephalus appendiculatus]